MQQYLVTLMFSPPCWQLTAVHSVIHFTSLRQGVSIKPVFSKSSFISSSILYHGPIGIKQRCLGRRQPREGRNGRQDAPNREESPDSRSNFETQVESLALHNCTRLVTVRGHPEAAVRSTISAAEIGKKKTNWRRPSLSRRGTTSRRGSTSSPTRRRSPATPSSLFP